LKVEDESLRCVALVGKPKTWKKEWQKKKGLSGGGSHGQTVFGSLRGETVSLSKGGGVLHWQKIEVEGRPKNEGMHSWSGTETVEGKRQGVMNHKKLASKKKWVVERC